MRYEVHVLVKGERLDDLISVLNSERHESRSRSNLEITKENNGITFKVEAKDATALRATLNSITTNLQIFEKSLTLGDKNE
ncbi:hypothetical protein JXM83_03980 [Candidatus Woesearchaeota archaeon]|nr:hypothetical protein [Candidatus Woesearchaeota archaeon]